MFKLFKRGNSSFPAIKQRDTLSRFLFRLLIGVDWRRILKGESGKQKRYKYLINEYGRPGGNRTPDLRFRKPLLYPSELQARNCDVMN
jgi:hypothetical protein